MEPIDDRNVEDMNLTTRQDNSLNPSVRADNTGVLILLIRSRKEAQLWFSTILSIAMFLFVLGIVTNGVICFVMLPGKRYKKNTSNFYILHLSVTDLVSRLLISPIVMYSVVTASKIESIQCKFLYLFSNTFASGTFVSLAAIATDRYQNIVYPMRALKTKKTTPLHQVFLVWSYAILVSIPSVVSVQSIAIYEIPEAQGDGLWKLYWHGDLRYTTKRNGSGFHNVVFCIRFSCSTDFDFFALLKNCFCLASKKQQWYYAQSGG